MDLPSASFFFLPSSLHEPFYWHFSLHEFFFLFFFYPSHQYSNGLSFSLKLTPLELTKLYLCQVNNRRYIYITSLIIQITISSIVIGLKNSYFSTSSLARLLSDGLLLGSLLSDSSIGQSHSKL